MIAITKDGSWVSDEFFIWAPHTFKYRTEFFDHEPLAYDHSIIYLN